VTSKPESFSSLERFLRVTNAARTLRDAYPKPYLLVIDSAAGRQRIRYATQAEMRYARERARLAGHRCRTIASFLRVLGPGDGLPPWWGGML